MHVGIVKWAPHSVLLTHPQLTVTFLLCPSHFRSTFSTFQVAHTAYRHHDVHYIPRTHCSFNRKFTPLPSISPIPQPQPLVTTSVLFLCAWLFQGPYSSEVMWCLHLIYALKVHPHCGKWQDFLLSWLIISQCVNTTPSLSIHLPANTTVLSTSWLLWVMLQRTSGCTDHFEMLITFPLGMFPNVELLVNSFIEICLYHTVKPLKV